MYLQSLELQGFKSFPDKIKLTFDKGLTAVVGPNGSGKSNIGDAVRWVLGEQSTKTLRGNKMEDVIFSGTKTRKPMGFAVVTLEINNETGELGDTYGAVVSVTRKLYRSGDSEYRINGKQVRLKDVTELFMDTGMGRDGYAIIGQGRIAEIVSAKSADRRDIFEEAAGVSKFRYKKQEAQRKLDAAQENLVRLQDIVSELESRVEPLRRQSEKAKQYVELAEQQKQLEISLWVRRLAGLREKLQSLTDGYLQVQAEYQNAELEINHADQKVQEGYRRMQECTIQIETIREKIQRSEEETAKLQAAVAVCENEIRHGLQMQQSLERQKEETKAQKKEMQERTASLAEQAVRLRQKREELLLQAEQAERDWHALENRASQRGKEYEQTHAALQQLYVRQSELRVLQQTTAGQQEELRAQIAEHQIRYLALEEAYHQQEKMYQEAEQHANQSKETLLQMQNQRDGFQKRYANATAELEMGKKAQEQASFALRDKRQRQKLLQDMERNMEGFSGSVKAVLRAEGGAPRGVFGTVAQLITTDQKYGVALETALGGAMQNLIVADENAAKQWIRFLAQNRAGRATFLPLTSVRGRPLRETGLERMQGYVNVASGLVRYAPQYEAIVSYLLGRIVVAEDLDAAAEIAKVYQYRFRIVTLDGQVINAGGTFTGGSAQRSGGMLTRRAELESLSSDIAVLEQQEKTAFEALQKIQAKSVSLHQQMQKYAESCRQAESVSVEADAQMEKCRYVLQQSKERLSEARTRGKGLQTRLEETTQKNSAAKQEGEEVSTSITKTQQMLDSANEKRSALQIQQEKLAQRRSQLKLGQVELEKDIETLSKEMQGQTSQQQLMQEKLAQLDKDISVQKDSIAQKQAEKVLDAEKIKQGRQLRMESQSKILHWQKVHESQDQQIRQIQNGLKEINAAREKYAGEMSRFEEKKLSVQADYDNVVRQLYEQYELSLSEAQGVAQPLEDLQEAGRTLQTLKSRIRGLGTVNVAAIAEYEEVSKRYQFLSTQMQDAETAKQELESLIGSLTEEMQRIFSESFAVINDHFREIFRDLFGGGEAHLELTDPENVLESGIEIKVAPPGKVIKNLIALSGGEQSFVAIAIYFAILRLRPSPFCVLDEIDAALDEGNVRRYAQYLQHFTDTTQFILVTHRRSAMEEANVLYGVTMQEDGVSRLLRMEQEELVSSAYDAEPTEIGKGL